MVQILNTIEEINYLVDNNDIVLIELYQDDCPACKQVKAHKWLEKLQNEFPLCVVAKSDNIELIKRFNLKHIPSFLVYHKKELINESYATLDALRTMIGAIHDTQKEPLQANNKALQRFEIDVLHDVVDEMVADTALPFSAEISNMHLGRLNYWLCQKAGLGEKAHLENMQAFTYYQTFGEKAGSEVTIGELRHTDSAAKYFALVALEDCLFDDVAYSAGEFMLFDTKQYEFVEAKGIYWQKTCINMKETIVFGIIFFSIAVYIIFNKLKEMADQPTAITKIEKKQNEFYLLQLHVNKDRRILKVERWVEITKFETYEQARNCQKLVEQSWNREKA